MMRLALLNRRRLTIPLAVIALAAAWVGWAAVARHRLAAARATLAAADEPADGLAGPPVSPDRNAADLYLAAAVTVGSNVYGPSSSNTSFPTVPPLFPPPWRAMAAAAEAAHRPAFALVHRARSRPDADWHVAPAAPLLLIRLTYLNDTREVANEVADAAVLAHLRGDDALAVDRVVDLLAMADAVDRGRVPTLVAHLVAIGETALALSRLQLIAVDARVGDGPGSIPRPVVDALVRQLADDDAPRAQLRRALRGEWRMNTDTVRWLGGRLAVLRPMADLDLARSITAGAGLSAVADWPDAATATAALAAAARPTPAVPVRSPLLGRDATAGRYGHLFSDAFTLAVSPRLLVTDFRSRAERRTTAALLALRLYHLDHGRWPAALAELVPAYLPAVPLDPIVGGGQPIGYLVQHRALPGGRDRVLLRWGGPASASPPPTIPASEYTDGYRSGTHWRDVDGWVGPLPTTRPAGP